MSHTPKVEDIVRHCHDCNQPFTVATLGQEVCKRCSLWDDVEAEQLEFAEEIDTLEETANRIERHTEMEADALMDIIDEIDDRTIRLNRKRIIRLLQKIHTGLANVGQ